MSLTVVDICNLALGRLGTNSITALSDTTVQGVQCNLHYAHTRDALLRSHPWRFASVWVDLVQDAATDDGTSTGTGNTTLLLYDTGQSWTPDAYNGYYLWITGGTGIDQIRTISDTAATYLTVANAFTTTPDSTSTYEIWQYSPPTPWDYQFALPSDFLRLVRVTPKNEPYELEGLRLKASQDTMYVKYIRQVTDPTLFDPLFVEVLTAGLAVKLCMPILHDKTWLMKLQEEFGTVNAKARLVNLAETASADHDQTWNDARTAGTDF